MCKYTQVTRVHREWMKDFLSLRWGSSQIVARGVLYQADRLPGFVGEDEHGDWIGLVTYHLGENQCEIVTLDSYWERTGIGSHLVDLVRVIAVKSDCKRLWLVTTNDNMNALRFYQKRGFRLVAVYPNAVDAARQIKPIIPLVGNDGIPIRDEVELEQDLKNGLEKFGNVPEAANHWHAPKN
ncbi:MAG TPA: GNAT family N-acetyltransferase [Candidatus Lokiarchaeia archaeon]|nr:GNAT family N-acetyltransferase [Candidatus Lokiarchaeia archaeon]